MRTRSTGACARKRSLDGLRAKPGCIDVGRDDAALGDALVRSEAMQSQTMARACGVRIVARPGARRIDHGDAVDGAGRDAQLATGAKAGQHCMHALRRADDRVDGTCVDAQRAAYAAAFVDDGDSQRRMDAAARVERNGRTSGQRGEHRDRGVAARRAAIDAGGTARDGLGVGTTAFVSATRALRLGQGVIDTLDLGVHASFVDEKRGRGGVDEKRVRAAVDEKRVRDSSG